MWCNDFSLPVLVILHVLGFCVITCLVIVCLTSAQAVHKQVQNKAIRIINNVPLRDHITPYYVNLDLIELPSIVELYDHLINEKPSNYTLSLVSEQHNYATWSAYLQHLYPCFSRINILRKFCPTVIGCYYWNDLPLSVYITWHKKTLYQYYFVKY